MQNERIKEIYNAAVKLFLQQGYSKTQISHIAKAVGVSVGTIYHDFAGKQEIMHFILKCTIEPSFLERDFNGPITDKLFIKLNDEIKNEFIKAAEVFSYNLKNVDADYTFENFISDAFDLLERYAVGCHFSLKKIRWTVLSLRNTIFCIEKNSFPQWLNMLSSLWKKDYSSVKTSGTDNYFNYRNA